MSINKLDDKWKKDFKDKLGDYRYPVRDGMWDDIENSLPQEKKYTKRILWTWIGSTAAMFTVIIVLAGPRIIHSVLGLDLFDVKTEKTDTKNKGQKDNLHPNKNQDIDDIDYEINNEEPVNPTDTINYESVNMDAVQEKVEAGKVQEEKEVYSGKQNQNMKEPNKDNLHHNKAQDTYESDSEKDNKESVGVTDKIKNKNIKSDIGDKKEKIEYVNNTKTNNYKVNEKAEENNLQPESNLNDVHLDTLNTGIEDNIHSVDTLIELQHPESDELNRKGDNIKKRKVKRDYSSWSFAISSKNMVYNGYHKQWGKMEVPNPPASVDSIVGRKKQFNHPINIGFTVRKQLNYRWAIEGGLSYTYLRSKETIINSLSPATVTNVKIHNIGISAGVEYILYRSRNMDIYSKYGAMAEKTKSNSRIQSWQISTSLSGGLSYRLRRNLGIFIEPGATYYFDNNTALPTLRNEAPLNFDVNVGLRLYPFSH